MRRNSSLSVFLVFAVLACQEKSKNVVEHSHPRPSREQVGERAVIRSESVAKVTALFMWKVAGERPTYLLGTLHRGVDAAKTFPNVVWHALAASDVLVREADNAAESPKSDNKKMKEQSIYPPGETLDQKLSPAEWKTLRGLVDKPAWSLKQYRPWLAWAFARQTMLPPPLETMDAYIGKRAIAASKKLAFLEEVSFQIDLADRAITIDFLKYFLSDTGAQEQKLSDMIDAYTAGDITRLEGLVFDENEMAAFPGQSELVYDARNEAWIPDIKKHIAKGNVFIAVGVGHFLGEKGILALLEREGYEVERVVAQAPR